MSRAKVDSPAPLPRILQAEEGHRRILVEGGEGCGNTILSDWTEAKRWALRRKILRGYAHPQAVVSPESADPGLQGQ